MDLIETGERPVVGTLALYGTKGVTTAAPYLLTGENWGQLRGKLGCLGETWGHGTIGWPCGCWVARWIAQTVKVDGDPRGRRRERRRCQWCARSAHLNRSWKRPEGSPGVGNICRATAMKMGDSARAIVRLVRRREALAQ
jgi:hypothetical protein